MQRLVTSERQLAEFADVVNRASQSGEASGELRERVLEALLRLCAAVELPPEACAPAQDGYGAHLLHSDPAGWSLTAVVLRPGERTPPHDHQCWGCSATVIGVERSRRYAGCCPDELTLVAGEVVPAGGGYIFDRADIHQSIGADPERITVALHFLVHDLHPDAQGCPEPPRRRVARTKR